MPPFNHPDMIAGNGTIGAEIFEDLPEVQAVFVPIGGGGLVAGIAAALRALKPAVRVVACEPETAAPFAASLREGAPPAVPRTPSFVDGSGASSVLPELWARLHGLVTVTRVVSLAVTAAAFRHLFDRHRVVADGAAGTAVAAALGEGSRATTCVAVVSGGNIDAAKLMTILAGSLP